MNKHDLLDAVGGIDPKYVEDAGEPGKKRFKIAHFERYALAAAGLILLIVAGSVLTVRRPATVYETEPAETEESVGTLMMAPSDTTAGAITTESATEEAVEETDSLEGEAVMSSDFNQSLISFIEASGYESENFMISPTSYRAALALAVAGADGETKDKLIKAMGFETMEEVNAWYASVTESEDAFNEWLKYAKEDFKEYSEYMGDDAKEPDGAFDIQNSIWRNTKASGKLSGSYQKYVKENFGATADNVAPNKITEKVNSWINKNTNGMIPSISNDLSYTELVLVNTLYLRTSWTNEFFEGATHKGTFHALSGDDIEKDFMNNQDHYLYYEDDSCKFVVLPMNGGIRAVFVLGDAENVMENLGKATYETVNVTIPKFENETSFSNNELIDYLKAQGAEIAFTRDADFSLMSDEMSLMITDIIQKTKIKVDETGIEAAAATAIMMTEGAFLEDPEEPKEFTADEPFKYMILTSGENPEMLFYGQIVE